jgi:hypothetical protein
MVNASISLEKELSILPGWLDSWPNGMYKMMLNYFDKLDDQILDLVLFFENSVLRRDRNF